MGKEYFSKTEKSPTSEDFIASFFCSVQRFDEELKKVTRGIYENKKIKWGPHELDNETINSTIKESFNIEFEKYKSLLKGLGINIEFKDYQDEEDRNIDLYNYLIINIVNKEAFLNYLKSLQSKKLTENLIGFLRMLIRKFCTQIKYEYYPNFINDYFIDLVSCMDQIIDEYKKLKIESKELKDFGEYNKYIKLQCLYEYILAIRHGIFKKTEEQKIRKKDLKKIDFHISCFNISYEDYMLFWDLNFFKILEEINNNTNPGVRNLIKEILDYGERCLKFAKENIEKVESSKRLENKKVDKKIFSGIKRAVEDVTNKLLTYRNVANEL